MEDLKRYLAVAAKHSFWIVTGLILILSSVVFYLTKTSLDESISTRVTALNGSFNKINEVSGKAGTHPNEFSHKEMEKRLTGLKEDVDRAWEFQYERQKGLLTWPIEAFREPKTHEIFDSLRPFEKKVPFPIPDKAPPPLDQITQNDLRVYRDYIAPEFKNLARRIGSSWKYTLDAKSMAPAQGGFAPPMGSGSFAPPGFGGGPSATVSADSRDLVRWSEDSQKALATAVLPWFAKPSPPTIHEIYYAQEDIWLLRGLMDIISQTNAGANENFQAIVKEIEWIRMGSRANRDVGTIWPEGAQAAGAGGAPYGGGGPPGGYSGGGAGGMPSGYGGMGGPGGGKGGDVAAAVAANRKIDPADGRYVDKDFKPLTGAQLRSSMNLTNANDAVNAVAKRVPVRMRLKVDERFGRLITECGNGKMMLEVLQVRYNTDPAPDSASGGSSAASGGGNKPSMGGMGGGAGMMTEGDLPSSSAPVDAAAAGGGEVSIEVFGLIYLYNPPANLSGTNANANSPAPVAPATPAANGAPSTAPANTPAGNNPASGNATAGNAAAGNGTAAPANASGTTAPPAAENPATPTNPAEGTPTPPEGTADTPSSDTPPAGGAAESGDTPAPPPSEGTDGGSNPTPPTEPPTTPPTEPPAENPPGGGAGSGNGN